MQDDRSVNHMDVQTELNTLREAVKEAVAEARQSSSFCQRIQRDISDFFHSEEMTRHRGSENVDSEQLLRLARSYVGEQLSEFEKFLIARVREELRSNSGRESDILARLDLFAGQLEKIDVLQKEQEGKLQALVLEATHKQRAMRREMKSYASKLWDHIFVMEKQMRSQTSENCTSLDGTGIVDVRLPDVARELVTVLSVLANGMEAERRANEEERRQCLLLMERMVEKVRILQHRDEVLEEELFKLQQVTVKNKEMCQESAKCVAEHGVGFGLSPSTPSMLGNTINGNDFVLSTQPQIFDKQIEDLRKELHQMNIALQTLQVNDEEERVVLEKNATDVVRLRNACAELALGTKEIWERSERMNQELNGCMRTVQEFVNTTESNNRSNILCKRKSTEQLYKEETSNFQIAQLLYGKTSGLLRSHSFQSWLAWTRGRSQVKRDKTILNLFAKQRNQLSDVSLSLHKLQESLQHIP